MGACDRALWFQVEPEPEEWTLAPTEEDAVQACVVVPTQYGNGVETEPVNIVSPDGQCHALPMPKGAMKPDVLAALATLGDAYAQTVHDYGEDIDVFVGDGMLDGDLTLGELLKEG